MGSRLVRSRKGSVAEEPSVNLTPLIDVVFSILIMFIVVAPLLELDQVELADAGGAQRREEQVKESGEICIHVHQDNTVWLNQRIVDIHQLGGLLKQERKAHPSAHPQVFHDRRASFGIYQSIKNASEEAGFEQLDVVLKPA